ncbi:type II secretion system (T2SS), protein K [Antarctobacter heliothermus]|uniref:Type II secretion system protein K n=1 Tax=Antarctobacter heliothermus TaxID=74033 RepID=A0A222DY97_9RHOB|nr:type II secretion system minor pseudopilin GspK [Antarctobacter heliothermus]ASP18929.1 type II secretion system (T2SS), protein K [Antarctobacter heliothermus]
MRAQRGFILVNALVLVGALAAAAAVLLIRAEMSVQRQAAWQGAAQIDAYLDAFEALAITVLEADPAGGPDTTTEGWAQPIVAVDLDRGAVTGTIEDLQGRFNVNWLAIPDDLGAQEGFARLLAGLGMPPELGTQIAGFLSPGGPLNVDAYSGLDPATRPRGGPLLDTRQLLGMPGLSRAQFDRLEPLIAALPSDTRLNVNTATPEVLAVWLPGMTAERAQRLVARRTRAPFTSVQDFLLELSPAVAAELDDTRISIGSEWFLARASARLDGRVASRRVVLSRHPLPVGVLVDYRLPDD